MVRCQSLHISECLPKWHDKVTVHTILLDYPIYWDGQLWKLGGDEVRGNTRKLMRFISNVHTSQHAINTIYSEFAPFLLNAKFAWIAAYHAQSAAVLQLSFTKSWDLWVYRDAVRVVVRIYNTRVRTRLPTRLWYY